MDLSVQRLNQGERVAAVAALVLFGCMFLSWFSFGFVSWTAWEALHFIAPILAITIFTTVGSAFAKLGDRSLGDLPADRLVFGLGCLSALLILFRLIDPVSFGIEGVSEGASVEVGAFLGFIAALGVAAGGYMQIDGDAAEKLRRLMPSGGGPAPTQSPPPPPPPPPPADAANPPAAGSAPLPPVTQPPASSAAQAFCEHCGAPMGAEDQFCRKCGQRQSELTQPHG